MISLKECEKWSRSLLSDSRFDHSRCVSEEAGRLAEQYGADAAKARAAGMLHDICKEMTPEEQLKIVGRFGIMMNETEKQAQKLYHAISGAAYAEHVIGVKDPEILGAIRWHTSGRAGMTLLEKVVFTADFISADRDYPGVEEMRRLAQTSLEEAMLFGISYTVTELMEHRLPVDIHTAQAYNDILTETKKRGKRV